MKKLTSTKCKNKDQDSKKDMLFITTTVKKCSGAVNVLFDRPWHIEKT